jgi:hypothetical protein
MVKSNYHPQGSSFRESMVSQFCPHSRYAQTESFLDPRLDFAILLLADYYHHGYRKPIEKKQN